MNFLSPGDALNRLLEVLLDTTLRYVRGTQQDLQRAVETIAWT